jgi:signal transduction histidine kinase
MPFYLATVSAALAAGTTATGYRTWPQFWLSVALIAGVLLAQATWQLFARVPGQHRVFDAVFFLVRFGLTAALVSLNPWYGVLAILNYMDAPRLLPKVPGVIGVIATAFIMAGSQMGGYPAWHVGDVAAYLGVAAMNILLAGGFVFFSTRMVQQSESRREAIEELTATNGKLEAALRENAGLHAQLLAQAREAGTLDERARMAREIHDTLAQGLAGIVTQIQAARQAGEQPPPSQRHLELAERLARDSLAEARRSVHAMRPAALDNAELPEALSDVARDWSALHGVAVEMTTTGDQQPMHPEVELTLLRIAQEALTNVAKHAAASRVGLTLSYMEDLVTLDVRDDGLGFDPDRVNGRSALDPPVDGGFGLTGMRQRIGRLAGTFEVESEPGGGTAISASVPAVPMGPTGPIGGAQ